MTEKFKETFHSLFGGDTFSHLLSKNFGKVFPYNYTKRRRIGEEPTTVFGFSLHLTGQGMLMSFQQLQCFYSFT